MTPSSNPQLELAYEYVQFTNKNIYLTGKAGTGKTTFLRRIVKETVKRTAVVAPTGVAAINARGMTIHSLFQLPFGPFIPGIPNDPSRQRKFSKKKINLIRSLDLLVIDEISMVRADVLDAIDDVLRRYKERSKPFGGLQLLMIGDLHQLPPVIKNTEWDLLRMHYDTPYFFGSKALQMTRPITIQLTHIYRQSDDVFINLLNNVRENHMTPEVLETLNSRYIPSFSPKEDEGYITLTSHNSAAQKINEQRLIKLNGSLKKFTASVDNDFPEHIYPTENVLEFKKGAQVMFIKNDTSHEKLWYNGKIGQIVGFDGEEIRVKCPGDAETLSVKPVDWENVKFTLNEDTKEVEEKVIGTFTQYPLRLAWAITIHKSQGLTFERAIIDAEAAFAHGQVYVALSRCKSFEGIVLRSRIKTSSIRTDSVVKDYSREAAQRAPTPEDLKRSKHEFQQGLIYDLFDFKQVQGAFHYTNRLFLEHENKLGKNAVAAAAEWNVNAEAAVFSVGQRFRPQLYNYFQSEELPEDNQPLLERLRKGGAYFVDKLESELLQGLKKIPVVTDNQEIKKKVLEKLTALQKSIFVKKACFAQVSQGFSAQDYLKAAADAELDFEKKNNSPLGLARVVKSMVDSKHPDLYRSLNTWRKKIASAKRVPFSKVLSVGSLGDIAHILPTDLGTLARIKGVGPTTVKNYGSEIVDIVNHYCRNRGLAGNLLAVAPKKKKQNTKLVSYELYQAGKTIDQISEERGLVRSTIVGHLAHYVGLGQVDVYELIEKPKVEELVAYFQQNPSVSRSDARTHFDNKYDYSELKIIQEYMKTMD